MPYGFCKRRILFFEYVETNFASDNSEGVIIDIDVLSFYIWTIITIKNFVLQT